MKRPGLPLAALILLGAGLGALAVPTPAAGQLPRPLAVERPETALAGVPDLRQLVGAPESELRAVVARYQSDQTAAARAAGQGDGRRSRLESFYNSWLARLRELDFNALSREGQVDYILLNNRILNELDRLAADAEPPVVDEELAEDNGQVQARVRPIGEEGLKLDLAREMIPYTAAELVAIAEREFAWCEGEMRRVAAELGYDDWLSALEHVKETYLPPGGQPELVRDLAWEAIEFLQERNLVTVPPLSEEVWRMEMMPVSQQRIAPFFLGGETVRVAYPTHEMTHEEKRMSMRGNNPHFSRAVVHHELIPGHHLQGFMTSRYANHRGAFSTPFWGEGWALYWEMLLWDEGFPPAPEDEVGMLFWRSHRAARIIFSLSYHLGTMTPQECVEMLVERVGHERWTAEGEVRRSFAGSYPPLYQAAYMLGGLQLRALYQELVDGGQMTPRQFHDLILQGGRTPIEMVRARITDIPLSRDYRSNWRFAGDPLPE